MKFEKKSLSQWFSHRCERQLALSLWTDREQQQDAASPTPLGIPHRQIRPGLQLMAASGDEWQAAKAADLYDSFGPALLLGTQQSLTANNGVTTQIVYGNADLASELANVQPGMFLFEAEFDPMNTTFEATWNLGWRAAIQLGWANVRPDIIEAGDSHRFPTVIDRHGNISDAADDRIRLRVIDAKLNSEPGRGYYAEVAYYSLALAAWLDHHNLSGQYAVSADAALWPGSHEQSAVRAAGPGSRPYAELSKDLEVCPVEVFMPEVGRFFTDILPRVARQGATAQWVNLPWHVEQGCSGCDYLGQTFPGVTRATGPSVPAPTHCIPLAVAQQELSRIPYLSKGAVRALRQSGAGTVPAVAAAAPTDARFDSHHTLRAGRHLLPARATVLGTGTAAVGVPGATTVAVPGYADLTLYVTADFDPTSAITLAFGISGFYVPTRTPVPLRVFATSAKSVPEEWAALDLLLSAIEHEIAAAVANKADATLQVIVWDQLTFEHMTRVLGRHLVTLMTHQAGGRAGRDRQRLTWLFPPEELVGDATFVKTPAVAVLSDAVKGLVAADQPHAYTCLGIAQVYNEAGFNPAWAQAPPFWSTEFSDQIPGERAFEIWTRHQTATKSHADRVDEMRGTVRARHRGMQTILRRLQTDLRGQLPRAPKISTLNPPGFVSASSFLGSLLHRHSKVDHATRWQENQQMRATAPHEREAHFESAIATRLAGSAEHAARARLGGPALTADAVFQLDAGSLQTRLDVGDFLVAITDHDAPPRLLNKSLWPLRNDPQIARNPEWQTLGPWVQTLESALAVSIVALDRQHGLVAITFDLPGVVDDLVAAPGLVSGHVGAAIRLDGRCVLDPVEKDFVSPRIELAVRAIGNPAAAAEHEATIRTALGVTTRGPNRSRTAPPAAEFLWDCQTVAAAAVHRNTAPLRQTVAAQLAAAQRHNLNQEQWDAWEHALTHRLSLIWGPPGTGKSRTVGAILDALALDAPPSRPYRVLLTAQTWTAIDNVLEPFVLGNPNVPAFRFRSGTGAPPVGALAATDCDRNNPAHLNQVTSALANTAGMVIVGSTPQQASRLIEQIAGGGAGEVFDAIVFDEAGQLPVGLAVLALAGAARDCQVIVAGDPLQLPPIQAVEAPDTWGWMVGPLYEFYSVGHGIVAQELLENYRSNDEIVALGRRAGYPAGFRSSNPSRRLPVGAGANGAPPNWPHDLDWDPAFDVFADPDPPIVCVTYPEGVAGQWNSFEATLTAGIVASIANRLVPPPGALATWMWDEAIGVVTPHRAQRALITSKLAQMFPGVPPASFDPVVDTVERFQGQERDAIVASYAVGDPDTVALEEEFLQNLNRFNVLATRAKSKLVVVVTDELLTHIASDIDVIRSSRLLKDFAMSFCTTHHAPVAVGYLDPIAGPVQVTLSLRTYP